MSSRGLLIVCGLGLGGYALYRMAQNSGMDWGNIEAPISLDFSGWDFGDTGMSADDPIPQGVVSTTYLNKLAAVESSGDPNAKAKTSSASGLFQFVKSTGQSLGLPWGNDPSQPFGGANVSVSQQFDAAQKITDANAGILQRAGVAITDATLYAAHFLGPTAAVRALSADGNSPIAPLVGLGVVNANPFLKGMTVGDFMAWLNRKMG